MGNPPRITYSATFTRNMGNYESLKISVGLEHEPIGEENAAEAYNRIKDFVESRLLNDIDSLEKEIK